MLGRSLLAAALAAVFTTAATADGPIVYDWSGFYAGANAGWVGLGGNMDNSGTDTADAGLGTALRVGDIPLSFDVDPDGFIGGVQGGYNWQSPQSRIVFGLEGDIQWSNAEDSVLGEHLFGGFVPIDVGGSQQLDWLGSLRARLGLAQANWLLYATAGFAFGGVETSNTFICAACAPAANSTVSESATETGWIAGGGVELAAGNDWIFRGEALYFDLGDTSTTITYDYGADTSTLTTTADNSGVVVRAAISRKFGRPR